MNSHAGTCVRVLPSRRRGFNLIEVQVGLVILLVTTVGLGRLLTQEARQVQWVESHQVADGFNSKRIGTSGKGAVMTILDQPMDVDGSFPGHNDVILLSATRWNANGLSAEVDIKAPDSGSCGVGGP